MPSTYTLISSNVLSSNTASVTFSAIPSTYTDLVLRISSRNTDTGTSEGINMRLNSDTATNYSSTVLQVGGTSPVSSRSTNATSLENRQDGGGATANTFGNLEIYIPSYTVSQNKPISSFFVLESNVTDAYIGVKANLWRNTAAVTSILLYNSGAINFVSGSSFYLYGVKNA